MKRYDKMDYRLPKRIENSNKSTYGRILNIAGSDYMTGAAYLSSVSALKVGCGYCFLCSTERVISAVAAQTQNIVFMPLNDLEKFLQENIFDVVEIGCGLSQSDTAVEIFNTTIKNISKDKILLIDADGLNILSKEPQIFTSLNLRNIVLTPHPKEAARLLDCTLEEVLDNTFESAQKISRIYNAITVLKTHRTVVVSPEGKTYINTTGNNSMAKAGSGDVLAGMISGFAAQKIDLFEACVIGVYLHGLSGDLAKEELTEYSVMAEDLISYIPLSIKKYTKQFC